MPTTPNGTEYQDITFTSSQGYASTLLVPGTSLEGDPLPAVLYCHGSGTGDRSRAFTDASHHRGLRNSILDSGQMLIEGHVGGDHWGNSRGTEAYEALIFDAAALNPISGLVIYGRSMGGTAATWLATSPESRIREYVSGLYLNSAVQSLYWWSFVKNGSGQPGGPAGAYGIKAQASVAEFLEKTAGRDPLTFDPATFEGLPVLWIAGTADTAVDPVYNSTIQRDRTYTRLPRHAFHLFAGETHEADASGTYGHLDLEAAFLAQCRGLQRTTATYYSTPARVHPVLDLRFHDAAGSWPLSFDALNPPRATPVLGDL